MKTKIFLTFILFFLLSKVFATHNRAGEITYKHLNGYTFEITVVTYTFTGSLADRDSLTVAWGDNTSNSVERVSELNLPDMYKQNVYVGIHTYPGPGTYQIVMEDPNRNEGVLNIPNSVNVVFALKTILQINSLIGSNSTPLLLNMPIDKAALHEVFIHNPAAFDPDGDSLSYKLAVCLHEAGEPIPNFSYPQASTELYVDEITGDLVWNAPVQLGIFNVAMEIEEWRNGIKISSVIRDIQIEVYETDNNPPDIFDIADMCVEADSLIIFDVIAEDPDPDYVTLTAIGGAFELDDCPASFHQETTGYQTVSETFRWQTCCSNIQKQPYRIIFKATDDSPEVKLVDYENMTIKIIGPATEFTDIEPSNSSIFLRWNRNRCENVIGYNIYRKNKIDDFETNECQTGIPDDSGYELIATINNPLDTTFVDTNNGIGLVQGFYYCYRIVCLFPDFVEGYVSEKICTELVEGSPAFTKVTVNTTDEVNGSILANWIKPIELDTIAIPGPYAYSIFYSRDLYGGFYQGPYEFMGIDNLTMLDTIFDTKNDPSCYKLQLINYDANTDDWNAVGPPSIASSLFLTTNGADKKAILTYEANVPWENESFVIYRLNETTNEFDSIGYTNSNSYTDNGLINGEEYCYKVKSYGFYSSEDFPDNIENFSQISCVVPIDTIPPCPIDIDVNSECDLEKNILTWNISPEDICYENIEYYNIYYTNKLDGEFELIEKIEDPFANQFIHQPELTLAACYTVTAVDSAGNEGAKTYKTCIDECHYYDLPNVFTPNSDNINDLYHPFPYKFVEKVEMQIFNRWGTLIYETENPDINWDGKDMNTGKLVSDGVYWYLCDVYEYRLTGIEKRNLSGFIHVFGEEGTTKP